MKRILFTLALMLTFAFIVPCCAQEADPQLEYVMELKVTLGEAFGCGTTPHGNRYVIPITGGTFEGPAIRGEVLNGGADYQLQSCDQSRTDLEAIYCIRTSDGVSIHVRNTGIISGNYFYCTPKFEAPQDSPYAWLNNNIYICRPSGFQEGCVMLKVWRVK